MWSRGCRRWHSAVNRESSGLPRVSLWLWACDCTRSVHSQRAAESIGEQEVGYGDGTMASQERALHEWVLSPWPGSVFHCHVPDLGGPPSSQDGAQWGTVYQQPGCLAQSSVVVPRASLQHLEFRHDSSAHSLPCFCLCCGRKGRVEAGEGRTNSNSVLDRCCWGSGEDSSFIHAQLWKSAFSIM